ncbi:hypothetical protein ABS772_25535 [Methylorubrum podarium]|uniref:RiboL-PSP-HEPN domain-containing protein n=1 Tax=Methylorubrum podarium TaxID=200476 RepID=A0ABV1QVC2_9HYPH
MPTAELNTFHRSLTRINNTRNRMESLFSDGMIKKTDIEAVYEALFLRAVTNFESYLEQLFISILLGRSGHPPDRIKLLMSVSNKNNLITILTQKNDYLDWLPYNKTESRARIYLKDGKPFSELTDGDKSQIKAISLTRNAIAHRSDHSSNQFRSKVIGGMVLLPRERSPAGFLRSRIRTSPIQVRFEVYLSELGRIAAQLS